MYGWCSEKGVIGFLNFYLGWNSWKLSFRIMLFNEKNWYRYIYTDMYVSLKVKYGYISAPI
jgi:hypothetical protein